MRDALLSRLIDLRINAKLSEKLPSPKSLLGFSTSAFPLFFAFAAFFLSLELACFSFLVDGYVTNAIL